MASEPKTIGPEEMRLLARIVGVEIPEERLANAAEQVRAVYQGLNLLNLANLVDVEPAASFQLPWK